MAPPRMTGGSPRGEGVALSGEHPREQLVELQPQRLDARDEQLEREGDDVPGEEHERGSTRRRRRRPRARARRRRRPAPSAACISPKAASRVNESRLEPTRTRASTSSIAASTRPTPPAGPATNPIASSTSADERDRGRRRDRDRLARVHAERARRTIPEEDAEARDPRLARTSAARGPALAPAVDDPDTRG